MIDLDRSLVELADRLEIPGGDRLAAGVLGRIREPEHRPMGRVVVRWAGAGALVVAAVVAVLPGPRHVIARWLGFESVRIEKVVTPPTAAATTAAEATTSPTQSPSSPSPSTSTSTTVAAPVFDLGSAVSITEAALRTGLPDPTPRLLGVPLSVHVVQPPAAGQIIEVFAPSDLLPISSVTGVGALVSVFPGKIEEGLFVKTLFGDATVKSLDVAGSPGFWVEGTPHQLYFQTGDQTETDTLRLATNTLLWQRDGNVYRIEADITEDLALQIAATVG